MFLSKILHPFCHSYKLYMVIMVMNYTNRLTQEYLNDKKMRIYIFNSDEVSDYRLKSEEISNHKYDKMIFKNVQTVFQ